MTKRDTILVSTILAGSVGLAGLGLARAQSTPIDTAVLPTTTAAVATIADDTAVPTPQGCAGSLHRGMLDERAAALGMSAEELQKELDAGKPFYQIEAEHGVTYETVQQQRLDALKTRLDDMVKVGYLTQERADQLLAAAKDQPMLGMGFGGHHGLGGLR